MENSDRNFKAILFEWVTLAGIILACFLFLMNQLHSMEMKMDRQCERTDRLYELYVETQKENNAKWIENQKEMNERWVETQKDIKDLYRDRK